MPKDKTFWVVSRMYNYIVLLEIWRKPKTKSRSKQKIWRDVENVVDSN